MRVPPNNTVILSLSNTEGPPLPACYVVGHAGVSKASPAPGWDRGDPRRVRANLLLSVLLAKNAQNGPNQDA